LLILICDIICEVESSDDQDDSQSDVELNEFNKYNSDNDSEDLSDSGYQAEENNFDELDKICNDFVWDLVFKLCDDSLVECQ